MEPVVLDSSLTTVIRSLATVTMRARYLAFYFEVLEFKDAESALLKGAHILYPPHKLFLPHPSCQVSVGHVLLKSASNGARIIHL